MSRKDADRCNRRFATALKASASTPMSKTLTQFLAALLSLCCLNHSALAQDVTQSALSSGHPLIGVWRIDLQGGCFEEYTLRVDGTKLSQSGQERNESIFELSAMPSVNGFYRWADKITRSNGKPDCGGALTRLGHVAVNFIRLHASGTKFLLCAAEDLSACFAEFRRKPRDLVLNFPGPTSIQRAGCGELFDQANVADELHSVNTPNALCKSEYKERSRQVPGRSPCPMQA